MGIFDTDNKKIKITGRGNDGSYFERDEGD